MRLRELLIGGRISIHPTAASGFGAGAAHYERGRPGYPRAAIQWLAGDLGLREGAVVVDLAAGTGKLSRALAMTGAEVIAIEPLEEMRAAIPAAIKAVEGTAEAIPLPAASADAVTVGQAFHWFDGDAALAEVHRVLRPGGALGLLWNVRRMEDPVHTAIEEVIGPYFAGVPRHRTVEWRDAFERTTLFDPLETVEFPNEHRLDAAGLVAQVASLSAIGALSELERAQVLDRVAALAGGGEVTLRYSCHVHVARRRLPH